MLPARSSFVVVSFWLAAAIFWLTISPLAGQTTQLRGRVLDETGRVVPGAALRLTGLSTRVAYAQQSDELGRYQFLLLPPGTYDLTARHPRFREKRVEALRLEVDSPLVLDVTLEVGEVADSITVTGSQPLLNKVDGSLGNPMTPEQILGIPLNARNLAAAVTLQPGVTESGAVTGARAEQTNLTLDGIDVNDPWPLRDANHGGPFEPILRVTPDSIQEFRVVTSSPGASQGRSSGAQVSLITRSGTNNWHGAAYEYHRNAATAANDFFNNRITTDPDRDGEPGIARSNLIRNVFGGSVGGPVVRDRAFFFFNYEGRRDRSERTVIRTVPLAHMGEGKMRYRGTQGELIELGPADFEALYPATGGVNPAAVKVFEEAARKYPANDTGVGDQFNTGGYRFNAPAPLDWNAFTSKLDFYPAEGHNLFLRGNYQWDREGSESLWPDTPPNGLWFHPAGAVAGHSWTISPDLIHSFRYGFTRQAWSYLGEQDADRILFREVFQRRWYSYSGGFVTTIHNLTDDFSWVRGRHTFQFGTNIRFFNRSPNVDNQYSYDYASTNYMGYQPNALEAPLRQAGLMYGGAFQWVFKKAATNLLGRFPEYAARYLYGSDGALLPGGAPRERALSTDEFEFYIEDSWQPASRLTLNLGLRWAVHTPVSLADGFQVQPTVHLSDYFRERQAGAARGIPYNELISVDRSGPYYDRPGFYETDWDNFAPRVSFAWSPGTHHGLPGWLFGGEGQSVLRGGFAVQYDRASAFLLRESFNDSLGFQVVDNQSSARNVTDFLGPLFTGFDQDIRSLMPSPPPDTLTFPRSAPADGSIRLEGSIDDSVTTPVHYNWNLSFGRELPGGLFVELSYLGRSARDLLATRDLLQFNNLVDPASGMDWYGSAALLYQHRVNNTPIAEMPAIAYFENLFPNLPGNPALTPTQRIFSIVSRDGANYYSWVDIQQNILNGSGIYPNMFAQPQYLSLVTYSNIAHSDYSGCTGTLRKRFGRGLTFDVNYTWSLSRDNASGGQVDGAFSLGVFVKDAFDPDEQYAVSDFHQQHMVNANWLWELPFGRGRMWWSGLPPVGEALIGGWSLSGIFRWNSGIPLLPPYENRFATTRQWTSSSTRIRDPKSSPHKDGEHPNYWADPQYAYNSFRDALAGEVGERNVLRQPGYFALDFGLKKSFRMPWSEEHRLTFGWEVFNATNTQSLQLVISGNWALGSDAQWSTVPAGFGNMTAIQGKPREMQFSLRYDF